jgi:hypothetical protein
MNISRFHNFLLIVVTSISIAACGRRNLPAPASPTFSIPSAAVNPTLLPDTDRATDASTVATPPPVPPEYQALYTYLDSKLNAFSRQLNAQPKMSPSDLTFASELIVANGNRGEDLLQPQAFAGVVRYLDQLQALGVQGVKFAIKYPLLTPEWPSSSDYLAFYKKVIQELKRRNMKMLAGTGAAFTQPEFSKVGVNYRGMTIEKLEQGERLQVETIIRELRPDYITIANEPSTQTELTGVQFNARSYTDFVNFILKDLDRRGVLVGAGTGNWDDPAYIESLAKNTTLDYIDIHFYPISRDFTARAIQQAEIARENGKRVVIGETWLYKSGESEIGGASAVNIMARDVYSFWQPLDQKFLTLVVQFARQNQIEFVSPFWSAYFFAYADYDKIKPGTPYGQILQAPQRQAAQNILRGSFSGTGLTYKKLAGQ